MLNQIPIDSDQWAHHYIAKSQTCPLCFSVVEGQRTRKCGRVMAAEYRCQYGHRWNLTWVIDQGQVAP